jgi:hypothetical protein
MYEVDLDDINSLVGSLDTAYKYISIRKNRYLP